MKSPLYHFPGFYEFVVRTMHSDERQRAISELVGERSVIELGCGTGMLNDYIKGSYTGLDLNRRFIEYGRKRGRSVFCGDFTSVPQNEFNAFDAVIMIDVLHHVKEHRALLENLIKRDKMTIVCEPFNDGFTIPHLVSILDHDGINNGFFKWYDKEGLIQFFRLVGNCDRIIPMNDSVIAVFNANNANYS